MYHRVFINIKVICLLFKTNSMSSLPKKRILNFQANFVHLENTQIFKLAHREVPEYYTHNKQVYFGGPREVSEENGKRDELNSLERKKNNFGSSHFSASLATEEKRKKIGGPNKTAALILSHCQNGPLKNKRTQRFKWFENCVITLSWRSFFSLSHFQFFFFALLASIRFPQIPSA